MDFATKFNKLVFALFMNLKFPLLNIKTKLSGAKSEMKKYDELFKRTRRFSLKRD